MAKQTAARKAEQKKQQQAGAKKYTCPQCAGRLTEVRLTSGGVPVTHTKCLDCNYTVSEMTQGNDSKVNE